MVQPFYIGFFSDEISNSVVVATKFKAPVDTTCYIINTPPAAISCVKVYRVQWKFPLAPMEVLSPGSATLRSAPHRH